MTPLTSTQNLHCPMPVFLRMLLTVMLCSGCASSAPETTEAGQPLNKWTYILADSTRAPVSAGRGWFGLAFGDLNSDGYQDIASGPYFYRNPGTDMTATPWPRVMLPHNPRTGKPLDAGLLFSVTGDEPTRDILAEDLPDIVWLHTEDALGNTWKARIIAQMPRTDHGNGRTTRLVRIPTQRRPAIVLSAGGGTYLLRIPEAPDVDDWPIIRITTSNAGEQKGVGTGDLNRDGYFDVAVAAGMGAPLTEVDWWSNPGDGSDRWTKHPIGHVEHDAKMIEIVDINNDGRLDVIVTEQSPPAGVFWFEAPADATQTNWVRHKIAGGYDGLDSLSVADLNHDGQPDIIVGETKAQQRLAIYENVNHGASWVEHIVDQGKESHKGAQAVDLDGDGDLDLVSI